MGVAPVIIHFRWFSIISQPFGSTSILGNFQKRQDMTPKAGWQRLASSLVARARKSLESWGSTKGDTSWDENWCRFFPNQPVIQIYDIFMITWYRLFIHIDFIDFRLTFWKSQSQVVSPTFPNVSQKSKNKQTIYLTPDIVVYSFERSRNNPKQIHSSWRLVRF